MLQATCERIDCDKEYGGRFDATGPQCRRCDAGFVFRKKPEEARLVWRRILCILGGSPLPVAVGLTAEEVTFPNQSAFQRCAKCPHHAQSCNGSSVQMEPGLGQGLDAMILELGGNSSIAAPLTRQFISVDVADLLPVHR